METTAAKVVGPQDGKAGFLGSIGVRFMIDGDETDQGLSLVVDPISPRALAGKIVTAAPLALMREVRQVIANGLGLLGISAPDRM